jgi:hypothetical protein
MLLPGLSDQDAIARAYTLSLKGRGPIDGVEVWDGRRLVIGRPVGAYGPYVATLIRASSEASARPPLQE